MKNKLYTLSYFRKRLSEINLMSKVLISKYPPNDSRYWTISISIDHMIFCTCYKKEDDFYFEFWDGNNNIKTNRYVIKTKSMNVIIEYLNSIIGKK